MKITRIKADFSNSEIIFLATPVTRGKFVIPTNHKAFEKRLAEEGTNKSPFGRTFELKPCVINTHILNKLCVLHKASPTDIERYGCEEDRYIYSNYRAFANFLIQNPEVSNDPLIDNLIEKDSSLYENFYVFVAEAPEYVFSHVDKHTQIWGKISTTKRVNSFTYRYELPDIDWKTIEAKGFLTDREVFYTKEDLQNIFESFSPTTFLRSISASNFQELLVYLYPNRSGEIHNRHLGEFEVVRFTMSGWIQNKDGFQHFLELRHPDNMAGKKGLKVQKETLEFRNLLKEALTQKGITVEEYFKISEKST